MPLEVFAFPRAYFGCYTCTIKPYLRLTKPGVLFGNVLTTVAGYLFGSIHGFDFVTFLATVTGTTLVIASACVINNYLDQDIDARMERTKKRPLIEGSAKPFPALIFGISLGLLGLLTLSLYSDVLVLWLGIIGFITYVWLYGAFSKRQSVHGTLVGSVSGAIPIMAGYVAAVHGIDLNATLLFLMLFFWQEPEFYSIAIYRRKEYKAANIPVISVVRGVKRTRLEIFIYTVLFVVTTLLLAILGSAGYSYLVVMTLASIYFIRMATKGLSKDADDAWARKMFHASINILMLLCLMLCLNPWLP